MTALRLLGYAWCLGAGITIAAVIVVELRESIRYRRDRRQMWREVRGLERLGEGGAG